MKFTFLHIAFLIVLAGFSLILYAEGEDLPVRYAVSGYVRDAQNGEALVGAQVYVANTKSGVVVNQYGFYSISLPKGDYDISYHYVGYSGYSCAIHLKADTTITVELQPESKNIDEVVVRGEKADKNISQAEMSVSKIPIQTIRQIPALMGEVDIIKAIMLLPGVLPTSEGTSGFSVRGGGIDQNLIILDEATVYNASHLMGFFSVFNNDAIRDVKLYKGDIPASYGGRLSSVLDVRMREGNNKKFSATGGVGLISSRLTLEGPIVNEKTSFLISGRRTYADLFFPLLPDTGVKKSIMYFYDLNLKVNHTFNDRNRLYLSAYLGRDKFGQKGMSDAGFGNQTVTLRWNHLFSNTLFSNFTLIRSRYDYDLSMHMGGSNYQWNSSLLDYSAKMDMNFFASPRHEIRFGAVATYHDINPCTAYMISPDNSRLNVPYPKNYEMEYAAYFADEYKITGRLTLKYGLRYSVFQNIGKGTLYTFDSNYTVQDTTYYPSGRIYHTYQGLEPRLGLVFTLNDQSSVKASYSRTIQYMSLASNSTSGMPLDVWFPASPNVKPQSADQFGVGYFRNFFDNRIETSVEGFYKKMYHVIDFKDHAELLMNPRMEGEIRTGRAHAYGIEMLVRKPDGVFNGWISYTYSRSLREIPAINHGLEYPSPYDKPHTVNLILNYQFSKRTSISANWVYATGAPITFPIGSFVYENAVNKIYSSRNGYRMRDYHRLDLSVTGKGKDRPGRPWQGEWVFSVYNAYGRHNDWIINFNQEKQRIERWYLPFVFFPGITYNFTF